MLQCLKVQQSDFYSGSDSYIVVYTVKLRRVLPAVNRKWRQCAIDLVHPSVVLQFNQVRLQFRIGLGLETGLVVLERVGKS